MNLNRNDLRKIQYDFNSIANRLLQADFQDYSDVLFKFLRYMETTPIIFDYIVGCGPCELDLGQEVKEVQTSRALFETGETDEEEVRNVYAILRHIVDNRIEVPYLAMWYSSSNKYQDKVKSFNERFVMVLIRHIEKYLTKVGIDMGLDDKVTYNVSVQNGQAIIATENATVMAANNVGIKGSELEKLVEAVRVAMDGVPPEEQETVSDSLEAIQSEAMASKPKKGILKTAMAALQGVKGTVEFAAAVATLIQFISPLVV